MAARGTTPVAIASSLPTTRSAAFCTAGKLWGHEHFDVHPDIMTLAKPLAGGMPIGAVLMKQRVADVMQPGDHGSTFAGGPLVTGT